MASNCPASASVRSILFLILLASRCILQKLVPLVFGPGFASTSPERESNFCKATSVQLVMSMMADEKKPSE